MICCRDDWQMCPPCIGSNNSFTRFSTFDRGDIWYCKCLDCLWRSLKMDGTGRRKNVILQDSLFFPWFHLGQADSSALYSESFDVNLCYVQAPRLKLHRFTVKVSAITKPSTNKSHLLTDTNIWLQWHFYHKLHYIKLHFLATILDDLRWIS